MKIPGSSYFGSKENRQSCLKFSSQLAVFFLFYSILLWIAIKIIPTVGLRFLYGPAGILAVLIAAWATVSINAKIFHESPPKPLFSNWQDRLAVILAVTLFFFFLDIPRTMGTDALDAHLVAVTLGSSCSIFAAYLFGSESLRSSIRLSRNPSNQDAVENDPFVPPGIHRDPG